VTGQIAHLSLDDGTRVTLAPRSTMAVLPTSDGREVTLSGEAYFVVRPGRTPFVVHTGAVSTRVLGTAFNVIRYPADPMTRVAVLSGKVVVGTRHHVTLAAGSVGRATDSTVMLETAVDVNTLAGWTRGVLAFRDAPVHEMLDALGHWYGIEFQLADTSLGNQTVTATFVHGESQSDVLALVREGLNVNLTFHETRDGMPVVVLRPKSHGFRTPPPARRPAHDSLTTTLTEVGR